MQRGSLTSFDQSKGFGFITPSDMSQDVFFHIQAVTNGGNMDMVAGATLRFEMGMNERNGKTQATRIVLDRPGVGGGGGGGQGMDQMAAAFAGMMEWMWGGW